MIGHNNPPTNFELVVESAETARIEAKNWADGTDVENADQADALSKVIELLRQTRRGVEDARKAEKKPYDDIIAEIQGRYNPLLKSLDTSTDGCKRTLAKWLEKLDAEKRAVEAKAREEADRLAREAQSAVDAANNGQNIEALEAREAAIDAAKKAEAQARRAANDKASAKGVGRAMSLRTRKVCRITDAKEAARFFWKQDPHAFDDLILRLATDAMRDGAADIPGIAIDEERSVA